MEAPSLGLAPVPALPPELQGQRPAIQAYVTARLRHFGGVLLHRLLPTLPRTQAEQLIAGTMADIARNDISQQRYMRLVLRHDCQCVVLTCMQRSQTYLGQKAHSPPPCTTP
ncbi:hypothetical protein V8C86DRAFT_86174 [Haematococcus lacustris]